MAFLGIETQFGHLEILISDIGNIIEDWDFEILSNIYLY